MSLLRIKLLGWQFTRALLVVSVAATLIFSLFLPGNSVRHFTYLAQAFSSGSFTVNSLPADYRDKVIIGGNTYLPLQPMPAILLMPFVSAFGLAFDDLFLAYFFTAISVLVMLLILRRLKIPPNLHRWLLALFFCGTIYLSSLAAGRSWLLAPIMATTFLLLAILEVLGQQRAPLIGAWLGLAFLARSPTLFALPFFVWMLKPKDRSWLDLRGMSLSGVKLALGLAPALLFFFYYNYARFGSPLETGYANAIVTTYTEADALKLGLFSIAHLPKNLYALLLAPPQAFPSFYAPALTFPYIFPSPWGMGIFFTTPAFVYIFAAGWRERLVRASWTAVLLVLVPLVLYYGVGWIQFGYRYALDLYPFLFILTALGISRANRRTAHVLIALCILINVWGAWWQMIGFRMLPEGLL